jgi:hypothetical protein
MVANSIVATRKSLKFEPLASMCEVTADSSSILTASRDEPTVSKFAPQCNIWCSQIQNLLSVTE